MLRFKNFLCPGARVRAWRGQLLSFAVVPCTVVVGGLAARADTPIGLFKRVVPLVESGPMRAKKWSPVRARGFLFYGTRLHTGRTGAASILFNNGTETLMGPNSYLTIEPPSSTGPSLILRVARAFSQVLIHPKGSTEVRTNAATAAARGTQFVVRNIDENTTQLFVTEGSVIFFNDFGREEVVAGQTSVASVGSAPTPPRAFDVTGRFEWTASVSGLPLEFPAGPNDSPALRAALAQTSGAEQRKALQVLAAAGGEGGGGPGDGPEGARILAALGLVELREGNIDASLKYLREATERDGRLATPRAVLSLALLSQNQVGPAVAEARRGVELSEKRGRDGASHTDAEKSLARSSLAHALFFAGRGREALGEANRAQKLAGSEGSRFSPFALMVRGRVLLARNRPDQALEAFAQASTLAPGLFLAQREVGASYAARRQWERSEKALRRALELSPDDARSYALLGDALANQGRKAESRLAFGRALELEPRNGLARTLLGQALLEEGLLQEARAQLEQANLDDPDVGLTLVRLSEDALYRQDLSTAQDFARRGVAALPESAAAHYQLGRVFWEQGRITNAEAEFRQAVTLDQNFDEARYALGLARGRTERGLLSILNVNGAGQRTVGSAGANLSELDLQAPGTNDRAQGIGGDPTAIRSATRAFGNTQIDGAAGSQTRELGLSYLSLSQDRKSVVGLRAERRGDDGERSNSDTAFDRGELYLGRKRGQGLSGGFFQVDFEQRRQGNNLGLLDEPFNVRNRGNYKLPRVLAGFNIQDRADARTRFLVQAQRLDQDFSEIGNPVFDQQIDDRSVNGEVRHDRRIGERYQISAGASFGSRSRRGSSVLPALDSKGQPSVIDYQLLSETRQTQLWARGTFDVSRRLTLAAETRLLNIDYGSSGSVTGEKGTTFVSEAKGYTVGLPLGIATYKIDPRSAVRLRARKLAAGIQDFQLFLPNDPFSVAVEDLPGPDSIPNGSRGRSVELEYDRTFANSALLRVSAAQQNLSNATDPASFQIDRTRSSILRTSLSAPLGRNLAIFTGLDLIRSRAIDSGGASSRSPFLPNFAVSAGLQYLNPKGFFADLLGTYSGRTHGNSGQGSFGVVSARVGKRVGLRGSYYIEARNIFDKSYARFDTIQQGRQIRAGFVYRY